MPRLPLFPLNDAEAGDVLGRKLYPGAVPAHPNSPPPQTPTPFEGPEHQPLLCTRCRERAITGTYRVGLRIMQLCGVCGITVKSNLKIGTFCSAQEGLDFHSKPRAARTDYLCKGVIR